MSDNLFTEKVYVTPRGLLRLDLAPSDDEQFAGKAYRLFEYEGEGKVIVRFTVGEVLGSKKNPEYVGAVVSTMVNQQMGGEKSGTRKLAKAFLGDRYNAKTAVADFGALLKSGKGSIQAMVTAVEKSVGTWAKINLDTASPVEE